MRRKILTKTVQISIFRRDGWMCRWCKKPVIFAPVMKLISLEVNISGFRGDLAYHHAHWTRQQSPLLDKLGAVLDHVRAFSTGGLDSIENLVTACNKCNGQKSVAPVADFEKRPRKFVNGKYGEPLHWEGLSELFVALCRRFPSELSISDKQWLAAIQRPLAPGLK